MPLRLCVKRESGRESAKKWEAYQLVECVCVCVSPVDCSGRSLIPVVFFRALFRNFEVEANRAARKTQQIKGQEDTKTGEAQPRAQSLRRCRRGRVVSISPEEAARREPGGRAHDACIAATCSTSATGACDSDTGKHEREHRPRMCQGQSRTDGYHRTRPPEATRKFHTQITAKRTGADRRLNANRLVHPTPEPPPAPTSSPQPNTPALTRTHTNTHTRAHTNTHTSVEPPSAHACEVAARHLGAPIALNPGRTEVEIEVECPENAARTSDMT